MRVAVENKALALTTGWPSPGSGRITGRSENTPL